jgi:hypothetical protein
MSTSAGQEDAGEAADGGERVQPPGHGPGLGDVVDRQAQRPRRDRPEQDERHGEQDEDADERADEGARVRPVEGPDHDVEERPGGDGHEPEQRGCRQAPRAAAATRPG